MKKYLIAGFFALTVCAFAAEYYGSCGRCGWALDKDGKCTNMNCNQYGPNRD